jgi:hypothetical protein
MNILTAVVRWGLCLFLISEGIPYFAIYANNIKDLLE